MKRLPVAMKTEEFLICPHCEQKFHYDQAMYLRDGEFYCPFCGGLFQWLWGGLRVIRAWST